MSALIINTSGIKDQSVQSALSSIQYQDQARFLSGPYSNMPKSAGFGAQYTCSDASGTYEGQVYMYFGKSVGWKLLGGGTSGFTAEANNTVFAGPIAGGPSLPTFRELNIGDIPTGYPYADLTGVPATFPPYFAAQADHVVLAGPITGVNAVPTFRTLDITDIPTGYPWTDISLPSESAHTVFAGPITGSPATAAFRALDITDIPANYPWANLANIPASFTPSAHASTHQHNGSDTLSGQSINGLQTTDSPQFNALSLIQSVNARLELLSLQNTNSGSANAIEIQLGNDLGARESILQFAGSNYSSASRLLLANLVSGALVEILSSGSGVILLSSGTSGSVQTSGPIYPGGQTSRSINDNGTGIVINHMQIVDNGSVCTVSRAA